MTILHTNAAATADPILDPFRFIFEVLFLHGVLFLFLFFFIQLLVSVVVIIVLDKWLARLFYLYTLYIYLILIFPRALYVGDNETISFILNAIFIHCQSLSR